MFNAPGLLKPTQHTSNAWERFSTCSSSLTSSSNCRQQQSSSHSWSSKQSRSTMSEAATSVHLEKLKEQAEAQQRRRAPPLAGHNSKRQKVNGQAAGDEEEEQEGAVSRFAYAAADAIAQGSTCLMASCGFNRQRSAAKELLSIVKPLLPEGTQLQMVKVGCRGLAVVRLEPPVPVIEVVGQVLDQIQGGKLKHTRFCERIVPAETTCLLTSVALKAALTKVVRAYVDSLQQQQQDGKDGEADAAVKQPVQFAVLYKSRGVDKQILAEMEKEAVKQQQEQQAKQQDRQQQEQEPQAGGVQDDTAQQAQAPQQQHADTAQVQGLDRQRIIDLAAAVMEQCCKDVGGAKVNLRQPQAVVMVEVVPLLRQQTACAVAMLPRGIMSECHKLKIRPTSLVEIGNEGGKGGKTSKGKKQES